jgi:hypothetical protein
MNITYAQISEMCNLKQLSISLELTARTINKTNPDRYTNCSKIYAIINHVLKMVNLVSYQIV